jgi:hypothetical protein
MNGLDLFSSLFLLLIEEPKPKIIQIMHIIDRLPTFCKSTHLPLVIAYRFVLSFFFPSCMNSWLLFSSVASGRTEDTGRAWRGGRWRVRGERGGCRRMPEDASEYALRSAIAAWFRRHQELCRGLVGTRGLHHRRADVDASTATASAVGEPQASGRAAVRVRSRL